MTKLNQGFSLIEILTAVAIIALLASFTMMNYQDSQRKAQQTKVKSDWAITEGKYIEKLIGKWSLNEGSGSTTNDDTDFKNNGTLNGSPTWKNPEDCINEKCLEFNGSGQYISTSGVPGDYLSGSKARTISAWIYRGNETGGSIVAINNSGSAQSFIVEMETVSGDMYLFTDAINSNNNIIISGSEIPPLNTWSYIVFTYDGTNTWKYYLNGSLTKSGQFATTINTIPNSISIGRRMDGTATGYWTGRIDEVSVYSGGVTFSEIKENYLAGIEKLQKKRLIADND